MGRHSKHRPEGATVEKTYQRLEDLLRAFAGGSIPLLAILGRPGLVKSRRVRDAVKGRDVLVVRGGSRLSTSTPTFTHARTCP